MKISDIFTSVSSPDYPISQFNGDHFTQTTVSIGSLTPTKCIKYHPGDNFKLHSVTNVECPPLMSPSFQSFKLKEFIFKVRKGLTWKNDEYSKFVKSLHDGSVAPVMPFIYYNEEYMFGTAVLRIKVDLKLPVYGMIHQNSNGSSSLLFQTSNVPTGSFNDLFLRFGSLSDDDKVKLIETIRNSVSFEIVYENKKAFASDANIYTGTDEGLLRPAYTRYMWTCANPNTIGSPIDVVTPIASASTQTINSVTFAELGDPYINVAGTFVRPPFYRPSELLESLGYPVVVLDADQVDYVKSFMFEWNAWLDELRAGNQSATLGDLFWYHSTLHPGYDPNGFYYTFPHPFQDPLEPISSSMQSGHTMTIGTLLQAYAEFMICTGHGDGSPMDPDNMFSIQDIMLRDIMMPPCRQDSNYFVLDMGPLTSYWLIWNEYFRDASLSKEIGLILDSGENLGTRSQNNVINSMRDPNTLQVTSPNGVTYDYDFVIRWDDLNDMRDQLSTILVYDFYTSIPQKCIDRNYFTSALPDISKVQVFAPVVPQMPANGVVPSMSKANDVKPTANVPSSTTFMSIDAFRTANVLEAFFQNSMLAGPRPVSLILMHFGEHSKDFRMEIPELIDASEASFSQRELTQSSETEQLPLGFQVSQLSIVKGLNEGSFYIDSDGDHGYLIRMVCLYPEIFEVGGLNKDLLCDSPFDWMYFPAFGTLGEQAINLYEVNAQPVDISYSNMSPIDARMAYRNWQPYGYDIEFGYTARYGHLKRIPSEVHGRFLKDLRYWNMCRVQQPLSYNGLGVPPVLKNSMQFLAVPKDTRMFVDKDQDNFKVYQFVDGQFTRKLPMINQVKLL